MKRSYFLILVGLAITMLSCTSYENLLNYNNVPQLPSVPQKITNYAPLKIQLNDVLRIRISSSDAVAIQPFITAGSESGGGSAYEEYLVNSEGHINLPTIGAIYVKGLEVEQVRNQIAAKLAAYFNEQPIVEVRLANFSVNVNGEVSRPGSFNVSNERLTIIDALTMAGDFTSYSRRDSILIIREEDGMREFGYVDFNSAAVFDSKYFYLQQNDVVYVRPNKTKVNTIRDPATRVLPWITALVSLSALYFSITR